MRQPRIGDSFYEVRLTIDERLSLGSGPDTEILVGQRLDVVRLEIGADLLDGLRQYSVGSNENESSDRPISCLREARKRLHGPSAYLITL